MTLCEADSFEKQTLLFRKHVTFVALQKHQLKVIQSEGNGDIVRKKYSKINPAKVRNKAVIIQIVQTRLRRAYSFKNSGYAPGALLLVNYAKNAAKETSSLRNAKA